MCIYVYIHIHVSHTYIHICNVCVHIYTQHIYSIYIYIYSTYTVCIYTVYIYIYTHVCTHIHRHVDTCGISNMLGKKTPSRGADVHCILQLQRGAGSVGPSRSAVSLLLNPYSSREPHHFFSFCPKCLCCLTQSFFSKLTMDGSS
jgi:hypothetical protein